MSMLAIFCTHAINIYAGVNGLEVGQSVVLALSVVIHNLIEINGPVGHYHKFSLFFLIPFIAVSIALLRKNWCPAEVFVGDTYCYFAGMVLAVVGILGHFSKTLLLFFIPQTVNFILSIPQLFKLVPCPRHRLPALNHETGLLEPSTFEIDTEKCKQSFKLHVLMFVFQSLGLVRSSTDHTTKVANLTLINLFLCWFGPCEERKLSTRLLLMHILSSILAFSIRYPLAWIFYHES
ncbi:hypothetical protein Ciccas_006898 [Cichlidogyrus casuarinus]|uniref:UDP-N-acetylglucosamine--dolichyl-phosphate N-acetylglucosaminephosphotransferase n=1 Tax=Cichlidogyrus casuarinus TaxID=1844966 RepID=A0ABD2Q4N6_9PLAT